MKELRGKTAVVTGAASGIGFALASRFALGEQMRVVLADVEGDALQNAVTEIAGAGAAAVDVLAVPTDVADPVSVDALASAAVNRFGAVHVVCNNAGVGGLHYPSWDTPLPYWEWVLSVNVGGVINGVRSFAPLLIDQDEGHIVNTASVAGLTAMAYNAPYVASKHAVVGLSATLFHELAALGSAVKVSVLCPAAVATRFSDAERNWPARLGEHPLPSDHDDARRVDDTVRSQLQAGSPPERVADLVVSAIRDERFMILTDDRSGPRALASLSDCLEGRGPAAPPSMQGRGR